MLKKKIETKGKKDPSISFKERSCNARNSHKRVRICAIGTQMMRIETKI